MQGRALAIFLLKNTAQMSHCLNSFMYMLHQYFSGSQESGQVLLATAPT
jgi:hypothetical protein